MQVNVDENGMNIVGDAGNQPTLVVDPTDPDRMAMGWRQFERANHEFRDAGYAFSRNGGRTWSFPGILAEARSDPVLDADVDGRFYYFCICTSGLCAELFRSDNGGRTWDGAGWFFLEPEDNPWMVVDRSDEIGRGNIYVAGAFGFIRSVDGGDSFHPGSGVSPDNGTLHVAADGAVYAVDAAYSIGGGIVVSRSDDARDPERTPTFQRLASPNIGGPLSGGGPNRTGRNGRSCLGVDESGGRYDGNLYIVQSTYVSVHERADIHLLRSTDGGRTWTEPIRVNDDPPNNWQWFAAMDVAPETGRIDIVWHDTRNTVSENQSELHYAYSTDGGQTFSQNMPIGPIFDSWLEMRTPSSLGDYHHVRSDNQGPRIAYTATYNGEQDIYYLHAQLDCNGNGLHDGDDVALGRSPDVNGNGVPDDCPCDPIESFSVDCWGGRMRAKVASTFPEGAEVLIQANDEPIRIDIDDAGRGVARWFPPTTGYQTIDVDGCPIWGETVVCEYPCRAIKRVKLTCSESRLKANVRTALPQGYTVHLIRDGGAPVPFLVDERGRVKATWVVEPGEHTVSVEECPDTQRQAACE